VADIEKHKAVSAEKGESESFPPRSKKEKRTISIAIEIKNLCGQKLRQTFKTLR